MDDARFYIFKLSQNDGRKIMKRRVQWNPVYDWKDQGSNLGPLDQKANANNKCAYLILFKSSAQQYIVYVP